MQALIRIAIVALGGALGSTMRYLLAAAIPRWIGRIYLWGTFSVNVLGSFIIGIAWAMMENEWISFNQKLFLVVGLLGGFTTFSSFSLESIELFRSGQYKMAFAYITMTNITAITAAYGGFLLVRIVFKNL